MAKNISVSNFVYYELMEIKRELEKEFGISLSMSKVLEKLIECYRK